MKAPGAPISRFEAMHGKPCPYCRNKMIYFGGKQTNHGNSVSRDHVNPQVNGGGPTIICCRRCNTHKTDHALHEWRDFLRRHNDYRWRFVAEIVDQLERGVLKIVGSATPSGFDDGVFA